MREVICIACRRPLPLRSSGARQGGPLTPPPLGSPSPNLFFPLSLQYGFELQILPILAGFFTYKIATVVQVFRENLAPMMPPRVDEAE